MKKGNLSNKIILGGLNTILTGFAHEVNALFSLETECAKIQDFLICDVSRYVQKNLRKNQVSKREEVNLRMDSKAQ